MRDETPEEALQRYLRENPPAPRAVPRPSLLDRAVFLLIIILATVFWGTLARAVWQLFTD